LLELKRKYEAKATSIDDRTAEAVAASYMVVASAAQFGGITAGNIWNSPITFNTSQPVDPVIKSRQLQAKETLWNIILKLGREFSMVTYVDNIFTAEEIGAYFSSGTHSEAIGVIAEYRDQNYAHCKFISVNPEAERPFIPPRLWSIVYIMRAIYGRAALLLEWSFERERYRDWRTDRVMDQLLRTLIPAVHVEEIQRRTVGGLNAAIGYLQDLYLLEAAMQGHQ
jgi:hypothetical protein